MIEKNIMNINHDMSCWLGSLCCLYLVCLYPNVTYALLNNAGLTYIITSTIFLLPVVALIGMIKHRRIYCTVLILLTLLSLVDQTMVDIYGDYLLAGGIISTIKTNPMEAHEFISTNIGEIFHWTPLIVLCVLGCVLFREIHFEKLKGWCFVGCCIFASLFVAGKVMGGYHGNITFRYYITNRILNRTPYNVFYQSYNAAVHLRHLRLSENAKKINMGAHRQSIPVQKEIYVFAIGESLRYDNLSLNGHYHRTTTPQLETYHNLILFDNYYSQACLTMLSVPQLITRATSQNFDLNYAERSIIEPFRECGFKVFTVVSNTNLLSYERYLSDGADSIIVVSNVVKDGKIISGDKDFAHIVDSLANRYDKLFVMMQFLGNHSFYANYEKQFERYNPNSNNCPASMTRDSVMLINAYDNSILYTDFVLSSIIDAINRPNTISALMFVSDHGECIGNGGCGHGGTCRPVKQEYHTPCIFWWSDDYASLYSDKISFACTNKAAKWNGDCIFYSLCGMADIRLKSDFDEPTWSIFSTDFVEHKRYILLPDGKNCMPVE